MFVAVLSLQQWLILTGLYVEVKPFPYLWFLVHLNIFNVKLKKYFQFTLKKFNWICSEMKYVVWFVWSVKSFRLRKFLQGHPIETSDEKSQKEYCVLYWRSMKSKFVIKYLNRSLAADIVILNIGNIQKTELSMIAAEITIYLWRRTSKQKGQILLLVFKLFSF